MPLLLNQGGDAAIRNSPFESPPNLGGVPSRRGEVVWGRLFLGSGCFWEVVDLYINLQSLAFFDKLSPHMTEEKKVNK